MKGRGQFFDRMDSFIERKETEMKRRSFIWQVVWSIFDLINFLSKIVLFLGMIVPLWISCVVRNYYRIIVEKEEVCRSGLYWRWLVGPIHIFVYTYAAKHGYDSHNKPPWLRRTCLECGKEETSEEGRRYRGAAVTVDGFNGEVKFWPYNPCLER